MKNSWCTSSAINLILILIEIILFLVSLLCVQYRFRTDSKSFSSIKWTFILYMHLKMKKILLDNSRRILQNFAALGGPASSITLEAISTHVEQILVIQAQSDPLWGIMQQFHSAGLTNINNIQFVAGQTNGQPRVLTVALSGEVRDV